MPLSGIEGVVGPDDFEVLEAVFSDACQALEVARNSPQAEQVALKIMILFQSGIEDRRLLVAAVLQSESQGTDQAA
jgi:hypothetical protein